MFEYHGWVHLSETTCDAEDDEVQLQRIVAEAKALCLAKSDDWGIAEVKLLNGLYFVTLHGFRNHRQEWVVELFSAVGALGRGSYGTLYIRDDEDPQLNNELQYFVMRRGKILRVAEEHLSPCMPILEE